MAQSLTEEIAEGQPGPETDNGSRRPRRWVRRLGTTLLVLGVVLLAYGAAVYFWHDPVTDLYARWKQHQLDGQLAQQFEEFQQVVAEPGQDGAPAPVEAPSSATADPEPTPSVDPSPPPAIDPAALEQDVRRLANAMYQRLELGKPLGRIIVPKLDQDLVFVNGTRWGADLTRGPGRYPETELPGMGRVTAIAGHRTTFGAPFRHIDRLKEGDEITLELPYGTFHYRVTGHRIVDDTDWSVIEPQGGDTLVLSACHPLYSASQRWIVFAELDEVETIDGATFSPGAV